MIVNRTEVVFSYCVLSLIQIHGKTLKEVKLPEAFLLEMLELNEQIDEADDEVIQPS